MTTQQPIECDAEKAEELFADDDFCAQEKLDGIRCVITISGGHVTAQTRNGKPVILHNSTLSTLPKADCVLDGELIGDEFTAFDLPSLAGDYTIREHRLWCLAEDGLRISKTATGELNKRALAAEVRARGGEGIVFKRLSAPYRAGYSMDQFKLKFWKSETFRVVAVDAKALTLEFQGADAGRVTGTAKVGDLVEVRFQKRHASGKLASPVMLGIRHDL